MKVRPLPVGIVAVLLVLAWQLGRYSAPNERAGREAPSGEAREAHAPSASPRDAGEGAPASGSGTPPGRRASWTVRARIDASAARDEEAGTTAAGEDGTLEVAVVGNDEPPATAPGEGERDGRVAGPALPAVIAHATVEGEIPPPDFETQTPCGTTVKDESFLVGEDGGLANVLLRVLNGTPHAPATPVAKLTFRACGVSARVVPITLGQGVVLQSGDDVEHRLMLRRNDGGGRGLHLPANRAVAIEEWLLFSIHPLGYLRVECRDHEWETAYLVSARASRAALTDASGVATLALPPGEWELEAWHERLGPIRKTVTVGTGVEHVSFEFVAPALTETAELRAEARGAPAPARRAAPADAPTR